MLCTTLLFHVFVNLPLLVLTLYFNWLWPLALASVALSLSVCAVAAAQAHVPREKRRWWSRPVIAAMFLLQPIVRGWHRLKVRLNFELAPPPQQLMAPRPRCTRHDCFLVSRPCRPLPFSRGDPKPGRRTEPSCPARHGLGSVRPGSAGKRVEPDTVNHRD